MCLWHQPSGRSHAHFDERVLEFGESKARVEILGMGLQAKIPGMGPKRDGPYVRQRPRSPGQYLLGSCTIN